MICAQWGTTCSLIYLLFSLLFRVYVLRPTTGIRFFTISHRDLIFMLLSLTKPSFYLRYIRGTHHAGVVHLVDLRFTDHRRVRTCRSIRCESNISTPSDATNIVTNEATGGREKTALKRCNWIKCWRAIKKIEHNMAALQSSLKASGVVLKSPADRQRGRGGQMSALLH